MKRARRIDLTGKRFGKLLVTGFSHTPQTNGGNSRHAYWHCTCSCGEPCVVPAYALKIGNTKSCGCLKRPGKLNAGWRGCGDLSGRRFKQIKNTAKKRKKAFAVTLEYCWRLFENQRGLCALTGEPLHFPSKKDGEFTASLDCIVPALGYVEGNLQWVHTTVNQMKWDSSVADLLAWVEKIHKHQQASSN